MEECLAFSLVLSVTLLNSVVLVEISRTWVKLNVSFKMPLTHQNKQTNFRIPLAVYVAYMSLSGVSIPSGEVLGRSYHSDWQWRVKLAPGQQAQRSGSSGYSSGWSLHSSGTTVTHTVEKTCELCNHGIL